MRKIVGIAGERCQWAVDDAGEIYFYDGQRWIANTRPLLPQPMENPAQEFLDSLRGPALVPRISGSTPVSVVPLSPQEMPYLVHRIKEDAHAVKQEAEGQTRVEQRPAESPPDGDGGKKPRGRPRGSKNRPKTHPGSRPNRNPGC